MYASVFSPAAHCQSWKFVTAHGHFNLMVYRSSGWKSIIVDYTPTYSIQQTWSSYNLNFSENVRKYIKYCIMSHIKDIFAWAIDCAHRRQTRLIGLSIGQPNRLKEIQWTFTNHLENIAYTNHQMALLTCPTCAPLYRRNTGKDQTKSLRSLVP